MQVVEGWPDQATKDGIHASCGRRDQGTEKYIHESYGRRESSRRERERERERETEGGIEREVGGRMQLSPVL